MLQYRFASFVWLYLLEALVAYTENLIAELQPTVLPGRAFGKYIQNEHSVLEKKNYAYIRIDIKLLQ